MPNRNACPLREDGVHDCTSSGHTCGCGYKFTVPRYMFSLEIYDNQKKETLVDKVYHSDSLVPIANDLEEAAKNL